MVAKIIVVGDNSNFVAHVRTVFARDGYQIIGAYSRWDVLRTMDSIDPDLIIVDVMIPHVEGWETCKYLRATSDVPVLMFAASEGCDDVAKGRLPGADSEVNVLYRGEGLRAQVESLLQHGRQSPASRGPRLLIVDDDLALDFERRAAIVRGQVVALTPTEFRLLACLAEGPGRVWAYDELWREVWGWAAPPDKRLIQRTTSNPRGKVGKGKIKCVWGRGYRLG